jgi:predicted nucleic acid-binding Zn ribbon protein
MWVQDGPYMMADAYQNQKECSDEEREIVEKGADGAHAIVMYHMLALYAVLGIQAAVTIGKGVYRIGKLVGKHH